MVGFNRQGGSQSANTTKGVQQSDVVVLQRACWVSARLLARVAGAAAGVRLRQQLLRSLFVTTIDVHYMLQPLMYTMAQALLQMSVFASNC